MRGVSLAAARAGRGDGHARAIALDRGGLDHGDKDLGHAEELSQVEFAAQQIDAAQRCRPARLGAPGKAARRAHAAHLAHVVGLSVGNGARHHGAHVAAGASAPERVGLSCRRDHRAARNHVHAVHVVANKGVKLLLRAHLTGSRQLCAVAAVLAHVIDPAVPGIRVKLGERTVDGGVLLGGVGHAKRAEQVVNIDEAPEQAEAARLGRIGRLHEAGEAARKLRAVDGADAHRRGLALRAGVGVRGRLPGVVVVAPDLPALVVTNVAAGHAAQVTRVRERLGAHYAAAGDGRGLAVADGGDKGLDEREQAADVGKVLEDAALAQHVRDGTGRDLARVAARRPLADDVGEVAGVGVLDVAAQHDAGKAARVALRARVLRGGADREAAGGAGDVGVLDGGGHHLQRAHQVGELDGVAQDPDALAHRGRASDVHHADVAAGIACARDGILAFVVIKVGWGLRGLEVLRLRDDGAAQDAHVTFAYLHARAATDEAAGRARGGVAVALRRCAHLEAALRGAHARALDGGDVGADEVEELGDVDFEPRDVAEDADALARVRQRARVDVAAKAARIGAAEDLVDAVDGPLLRLRAGGVVHRPGLERPGEAAGAVRLDAGLANKGDVHVCVGGQEVGHGAEEAVDVHQTEDAVLVRHVREPGCGGLADETAGLAVGGESAVVDVCAHGREVGNVRGVHRRGAPQRDKAARRDGLLTSVGRGAVSRCRDLHAGVNAAHGDGIHGCLHGRTHLEQVVDLNKVKTKQVDAAVADHASRSRGAKEAACVIGRGNGRDPTDLNVSNVAARHDANASSGVVAGGTDGKAVSGDVNAVHNKRYEVVEAKRVVDKAATAGDVQTARDAAGVGV